MFEMFFWCVFCVSTLFHVFFEICVFFMFIEILDFFFFSFWCVEDHMGTLEGWEKKFVYICVFGFYV